MRPQTLSARQARFVQEYLVDGNGARAAVAAGYGAAGARVAASRLLTKANVQKLIRQRQKEDERRLGIERDEVIRGLLKAIAEARDQRDPLTMIRGYAQIARLMGFYAHPPGVGVHGSAS